MFFSFKKTTLSNYISYDQDQLLYSQNPQLIALSLVQLSLTLMIITGKENEYIRFFDYIHQLEQKVDCEELKNFIEMIISKIDAQGLNESLAFHIDDQINLANSKIKMARTLEELHIAIELE